MNVYNMIQRADEAIREEIQSYQPSHPTQPTNIFGSISWSSSSSSSLVDLNLTPSSDSTPKSSSSPLVDLNLTPTHSNQDTSILSMDVSQVLLWGSTPTSARTRLFGNDAESPSNSTSNFADLSSFDEDSDKQTIKRRRSFSMQEKQDVIKQVNGGQSIHEVAKLRGISRRQLQYWLKTSDTILSSSVDLQRRRMHGGGRPVLSKELDQRLIGKTFCL